MLPIVIAGLAVVFATAVVAAQDAASAVRTANKSLIEWTLHRNLEALARAVDDRLIWIDPDGSLKSKTERLESLASGQLRFNSLVLDEEDSRCFAEACLVIGRYFYLVGGVAAEIRFLRVFANQNGRWVLLVHHGTHIGQPHDSAWAPPVDARSSTLPRAGSAAEAEVLRAYQAFTDAVGTNDLAALERIYAADYRFHTWRGGIDDKPHQLELVRTGGIRSEAAAVDQVRARVAGDLAVVSGRRSQLGQGGIGARPRLVRHTAVFVKRGGEWQMIAGQVAPVLTTPAPEGFSIS